MEEALKELNAKGLCDDIEGRRSLKLMIG